MIIFSIFNQKIQNNNNLSKNLIMKDYCFRPRAEVMALSVSFKELAQYQLNRQIQANTPAKLMIEK